MLPAVSILIPVHNAARYLTATLASMSRQSFSDWEMVCIDDGSTDGSGEILDRWAAGDDRVRVIHQSNQGFAATLNRGLLLTRSELVARMDADDISMPERLALQVAFMSEHPEHVALGGSILKIDSDSDRLGVDRLPLEHAAIESELLNRRTGLFHPTVMLRKSAVLAVGGYRAEHRAVEDHDLWLRLAQRGKLANLLDVLLCYRLHATSMCWQRASAQRQHMNQVLEQAYAARGLPMPGRLRLSADTLRSAGGPGKWARMAARGYAPRTAIKHLRRLWCEPASLSYRLRMTVETCVRLVGSLPKLATQRLPSVP